jgi:hypothetical protein
VKKVKATYGQTIVDIAMQCYGCYEGVFEMIKLNTQMHLSYEVEAGEEVVVHDVVPLLTPNNQAVAEYYRTNNIRVNSSYVATITPPTTNNQFTYTLPFSLA